MKSSQCVRSSTLAAAILGLSGAAQANSYTLVDVGPDLGGFRTSINDSDEVAGTTNQFDSRALLWRDGRWHKLPGSSAQAEAIDSNGDVAGNLVSKRDVYHPVLWRLHQAAFEVPLPGGASDGRAYGINDAQAVVGGYFDANDHGKCFLWTADAGAIDLGVMGGGLSCGALAINDAGQVTGSAASNGYRLEHAFRWEAGVFQDLGTLTVGEGRRLNFSEGLAINGHGDIVGDSSVPPVEKHRYHAVLWIGSQMIDLHTDETFGTSQAWAINDQRDIVGYAISNRIEYGVRFTNPGIVRLDDEVSNLGRWHVIQASGVNRQGDIVAQAVGPSGIQHTVILKFESAGQ